MRATSAGFHGRDGRRGGRPAYLREIKGPFADIELMAVGGVNADNMAAYFSCGAS